MQLAYRWFANCISQVEEGTDYGDYYLETTNRHSARHLR
jgi:hypothetical protein